MLDALTLSQMQMFAVVAEAGSFRAGADRLHRVQSAVSQAVANLEQQLQVRLFDRSGHKPVLTPAGQALLGDVRQILAKVDALRARAQGIEQGIELGLSIAVDTLFPIDLVAAAIRGVHAVHPGIAMRIEYGSMGAPVEALHSGRCDIAISAFSQLDERIAREFLLPLSMVAVAAAAHPLAALARKKARGSLDDAAARHLQIVVEDASALSAGQDFDVLSPTTWRAGDMQIKLALLRAGLGWGKMPSWLVAADIAAGTLVQLPVGRLGVDGETGHRAYFCHRADKPLGVGARLLREGLKALSMPAARGGAGAARTPPARTRPRSAAPAPPPAARPPRAVRGR
jgi:DNA-binding transcriptional LysR family regulator